MADKVTFWKGVSAGLLAGMAIAAALRYTPLEKFLNKLSTLDGKLDLTPSPASNLPPNLPKETPAPMPIPVSAKPSFVFRREQPKDQEDASSLASARTGAVASFLRGSSARAIAEAPGTAAPPEKRIDHLDLSKPLRPYPRNLDLGSAG